MEIELLSYRLLWCRFFVCAVQLDDDGNLFRVHGVIPHSTVIALESAFIVFLDSPCFETTQTKKMKKPKIFLFFRCKFERTFVFMDFGWAEEAENSFSILSLSETFSIPNTQRCYFSK